MKTNPNASAFATPSVYDENGQQETGSFGLTKREYFAAMAMQGLSADSNISVEKTASLAIEIADALIKQLNKP